MSTDNDIALYIFVELNSKDMCGLGRSSSGLIQKQRRYNHPTVLFNFSFRINFRTAGEA